MFQDSKEKLAQSTLEKIQKTNKGMLQREKYLTFPDPSQYNTPIQVFRYTSSNSVEEDDAIVKLFSNERDRRLIHGDNISREKLSITRNMYTIDNVKVLTPKETSKGKIPLEPFIYLPDIFLIEEYGGPYLLEVLKNLEKMPNIYQMGRIPTFLLTENGYESVENFCGDEDLDYMIITTSQKSVYRVDNNGIQDIGQVTSTD